MAKTNPISDRNRENIPNDLLFGPVTPTRSGASWNEPRISPNAFLDRVGLGNGRYSWSALNSRRDVAVTANRTITKPPVSSRFTANPGTYGSRGGTDIDSIILHHTAGSSASGAESTLNSRGLSVHYIVDKDGTIYQMVGDERRAFHTGAGTGRWTNANSRSIGIEIVNLGNGSDRYTEAQYRALEQLVPYLAQRYNVSANHIVGHSQIGYPGRPASNPEPSENFDWQRIRRSVTGGNTPDPPTPTPTSVTAPTAFLERGDRNGQVRKLQDALVALGYMTRAQVNTGPGVFGPRTENALKAFQRDHRDVNGRQLVADGIYGPKTRGAMQRALQRLAPETTNPPIIATPTPGGRVDINGIVGVRNNPNVTPAFLREVNAMAERLGTRPEFLLAVMSFESGLSPTAVNRLSGATGLIQFLPSTARGLGTSTSALRNMTAMEQLRFVEKYFQPFKGRLGTLEATYTAVLSGSPRPNSNDVLFRSGTTAYSQNSGLDFNRNGQITAGEATSAVAARMFGGTRALQQKLLNLGFDPKGVDNQFGPNTSRAIAAFQRSRNLPATGLLDVRTGLALVNARPTTTPNNGGNNSSIPSGRPSVGRVTSDFGPRTAPVPGASTFHRGVDLGAPLGARVQSTAPGRVIHAGPLGGAGNAVIIDHGNGYQTRYFHLSQINVRVGQQVGDSVKIGEVGATGNVSGPHLHYEVHRNGQAIDPTRFF